MNACNSQIEQPLTKYCFRLSLNFNIFSLKSTRFQRSHLYFCTRKQKAEITLAFALPLLFPHISPSQCLGVEETFLFFFVFHLVIKLETALKNCAFITFSHSFLFLILIRSLTVNEVFKCKWKPVSAENLKLVLGTHKAFLSVPATSKFLKEFF